MEDIGVSGITKKVKRVKAAREEVETLRDVCMHWNVRGMSKAVNGELAS
jgi:hypothetical protein